MLTVREGIRLMAEGKVVEDIDGDLFRMNEDGTVEFVYRSNGDVSCHGDVSWERWCGITPYLKFVKVHEPPTSRAAKARELAKGLEDCLEGTYAYYKFKELITELEALEKDVTK